MRITFLGTGTSHGIPVIGCDCAVCTSTNRKNRRNRTGVWLHDADGRSVVIDVSSEFRVAALEYGLKRLDFALLTHPHSDHVSGLDDLRIFSQTTGQATPIYGDASTLRDVTARFAYAFNPPREYGGGTPQFELRQVTGVFRFGPWKITPLPVLHGPEAILGYRINNFAFLTDLTVIPEETFRLLEGVEYLALDCLRRQPHSTHLHLEKAIHYAARIQAKRTYFIHMCHEFDHDALQSELPENVCVAYDGLELESA